MAIDDCTRSVLLDSVTLKRVGETLGMQVSLPYVSCRSFDENFRLAPKQTGDAICHPGETETLRNQNIYFEGGSRPGD